VRRDLEEAPPFDAVADRLDQLLDGRFLAAHHAGFDAAMLAQEWQRLDQNASQQRRAPGRPPTSGGYAASGSPS
jgi:DNA polymerase III epsilon subunit-like protein